MSNPTMTSTEPTEPTGDRFFELFLEYHRDLPRQGPGSRASTERALGLIPNLPAQSRILVLGCGSGADVIALARATGGTVLALDLPDGAFDLVWSEGAVYNIGFETGLRDWRRLLAPEGVWAASELSWLVPDPPAEIRAHWDAEYPALTSVEANLATMQRCGYDTLGHFTLPEADWWGSYYSILEQRIPEFRQRWKDDEVGLAVVDGFEREIALTHAHLGSFGYEFYVGRTLPSNSFRTE